MGCICQILVSRSSKSSCRCSCRANRGPVAHLTMASSWLPWEVLLLLLRSRLSACCLGETSICGSGRRSCGTRWLSPSSRLIQSSKQAYGHVQHILWQILLQLPARWHGWQVQDEDEHSCRGPYLGAEACSGGCRGLRPAQARRRAGCCSWADSRC